jgi:hypothetical protein
LRAGTAPDFVRHKGAEGTLPVTAEEKIEILILMAADAGAALAAQALQTLKNCSSAELTRFLATTTTVTALEFAASHLAAQRQDVVEALLENPLLPEETQAALLPSLETLTEQLPPELLVDSPSATAPLEAENPEQAAPVDERKETLIQKIGRMNSVQKIKLALTGNQESRVILIRDSNKVVSRTVLQSPKLSDGEIENYASMKSVSEEILRLISRNRAFRKNYNVVRALLNNPRTPIDVALPLIPRMNEKDLKGLGINKNISDVIRGLAIKLLKQREDAAKPKLPGKKH